MKDKIVVNAVMGLDGKVVVASNVQDAAMINLVLDIAKLEIIKGITVKKSDIFLPQGVNATN